MIRQALANAGLTPAEVDAVEAHGTGTTLGDPIEAQALLATYGQERGEGGALALGSLKSNLGHTQAAAGVGGVIKMVMALREEALPKTLHIDEPSPHVDWSAGEIELLTEEREWKRGSRPRRAGISSFGMSGTNAHLILEEAPERPAPQRDEQDAPPAIPWALSAKAPEALAEMAGRLAAHVEQADPDPLDVAHTLLTSRASLPHRAVVVGTDSSELLEGLDALAQGKPAPNLATARTSHGKTAFLLSGQGSQRAQMGAGLRETFPLYAEAFEAACEALGPELGEAVKAAVFAQAGTEPSESLARTDITQASLFATEVALYELVSSFGLRPDYLIGHSIGEIVAAHLAGVLSLKDAGKLVAARGTLMAALPAGGAMASIRATQEEVEASLAPYEGALCVAALNSPTSITVSGEEQALSEWEASQQEKKTKRLAVSHAFHSPRIEPMLAELEQVASNLTFNPPQIPIVSNLSGEELTEEQATSPAYWAQQARQPVRFADGVAHLREQGVVRFLELGPDATLTALAQECLPEAEASFAATLRRERHEPTSLITALGATHASGAQVDLSALTKTGALTELPTYPFQRQRYWLQAGPTSADPQSLGLTSTEHPFLGASISLAGEGERVLSGRISLKSHPWLADHAVAGTAILPATAFAELALRAGKEVGAERVEELVLEAPLALSGEPTQIQVELSRGEKDPERFEVAIHSRPQAEEEGEEGPWTRHASGTLSIQEEPLVLDFDPAAWPPPGAEPIEISDLYERAAEAGLEYGPAFQGLEAAWRLGEDLYAEVSLAQEQRAEAERFSVHPALLDAAAHAALAASEPDQPLRLPFSFAGLSLGESEGATSLRARVRLGTERVEVALADTHGNAVCEIEALSVREVDPAALRAHAPRRGELYAVEWEEVELAEGSGEGVQVHRLPARTDEDPAAAAHRIGAEVLGAIQSFLTEGEGRLAILTAGAVAAGEGASPDPAAASVWGLVRSAQAEHPGRIALIDGDGGEASEKLLARALAHSAEPQLALREGKALAPRLMPLAAGEQAAPPLDPERTVLITGGLSGLGALAARHLAKGHGARQLLLAARRGPETPGAEELIGELAELGCEARAVACDVSNREELETLLASIPAEHPLGALVHCAGVLDDGLIADLTPERLDAVLAAKADAAWHLHELTAETELSHFLLYSSIAAGLESPGQGNYAAANAFLDALATKRRSEGLPATAIAWGPWASETEMTAALGEADRTRLARLGLEPFEAEEGLANLDAAMGQERGSLLAVRLLRPVLARHARSGLLPPILSNLVPASRTRPAGTGSLARRLAELPEAEREGRSSPWSQSRSPPCSDTPRRSRSTPRPTSKTSASTPSARWSCATCSSRPVACAWSRLSSSTARALKALAGYLLEQVQGTASVSVVRAARSVEEPVAIVGLSCRYPGGVSSPARFWEMLAAGRSGIGEFPADRGWDVERIYDPDPERTGTDIHPPRRLRPSTPASSTPPSSASPHARRWRWTRSSGCCSKAPGRRSRTRASTRRACAAPRPGSSRA